MQTKLISIFFITLTLLLTGCSQKNKNTFEYSVLYVETQGEFVVPLGADAPAIFSWTTKNKSIKGDIYIISKELGIKHDEVESFALFEILLLNRLSESGWQFHNLETTSTTQKGKKIRTAYRYIFKRVGN